MARSSDSDPQGTRPEVLPVSGTSVGRMMRRIWSMVCRSGERPPCTAQACLSVSETAKFNQKQRTAEDVLIDDGGDRQLQRGRHVSTNAHKGTRLTHAVETVGERLPELDVVTSLA